MDSRYSILICLLLFIMSFGNANGQGRQQRKGDEAFRNHHYQLAIKHYEKALKRAKSDHARDRLIHRLAGIYNIVHRYDVSASYYGQISESRYADRNNDVWLEFARILMKTEDSQKATKYFLKYLEKHPDCMLAHNGMKSYELVIKYSGLKGPYNVENVGELNTEADEFAATYISRNYRQIAFTSNRDQATGKSSDDWTGRKFSDLFQSSKGRDGKWSNPSFIDRNQVINTEDHEGTPFFAASSNTLYFTRCPRVVQSKEYCGIWAARKRGSAWGRPVLVLSDRSSNTGHPTLTSDELTIFFSSSRNGSIGGKDLWMAKRDRITHSFGEPINLGNVVNTKGNEVFPFLKNDSLLYFSSDGHPGFGGLDIYYTMILGDDGFTEPVNLLPPVNSSGDDFAIVFHPEDDIGFFSSNRKGGKGGDDLYSFSKRIIEFGIEGLVADNVSQQAIPEPIIYLINQNGDSLTVRGDAEGLYAKHNIKLDMQHDYDIVASKNGYFSKKSAFSTLDLKADHIFKINLFLEPLPVSSVILPEIRYNFGRWDIRPQYFDSLNVLYEVLVSNPNLVVEIGAHTDSRNTHAFNDELSLKRAQSVIDFLVNKGIDSERLKSKGFGKRIPRVLERDFVFESITFTKGTRLTDDYINSLPTHTQREIAHQLNRRTEFSVISTNYIPTTFPVSPGVSDASTRFITEKIKISISTDSLIIFPLELNGYSIDVCLAERIDKSSIDIGIVSYLFDNNFINESNISGNINDLSNAASINDDVQLTLDRIRIGSILLKDVDFQIANLPDKKIILGRDFLKLFSNYFIDLESYYLTFEF